MELSSKFVKNLYQTIYNLIQLCMIYFHVEHREKSLNTYLHKTQSTFNNHT